MPKDNRITARIRKSDDILEEHFSKVKPADWAHEARRLMEIAILAERNSKETNGNKSNDEARDT